MTLADVPSRGQNEPDVGEVRLRACEALLDTLVEGGVAIPPELDVRIATQRQVHGIEPGWLDLEDLTDVEDQLRALRHDSSEVGEEAAASPSDPKSSSELLPLIKAQVVELFRDHGHQPYAAVLVDGVIQTHAIESETFHRWLAYVAYKARGSAVPKSTLVGIEQTLAASARFEGAESQVFVRVGELGDAAYIDLGSADWSAVEVKDGSWTVVAAPPVKFRRPNSALALPIPVGGGSIDLLWKYVNVHGDDRLIVLAWLLAALNPRFSYPHLAIQGEQGTAKSSAARILKGLVDPSTAPLRSMPGNEIDLAHSASHAHVLAFDNLSKLSQAMCDALCTFSTGGGITRRKLYTNNDELVLDIQTPVILTSINALVTRPDLADRTYCVRPPYIEPASRRSERELATEFEHDAPRIFGALLDVYAAARAGVDRVVLSETPRLADAARLAVAGAEYLEYPAGDMERALAANGRRLDVVQLDAVAFGRPLMDMAAEQDLDLTASELLDALRKRANIDGRKDADWPGSPTKLSQDLERLTPVLRRLGVEVSRYQTAGSGSRKMIRIRRLDREVEPSE